MSSKYEINTISVPSNLEMAPSSYGQDEDEVEYEEKEVWSGKFDFVLAMMGYSIGLGNILRFPYLCMKNGGGAFLIPYFIFLFLIAIPLYMIELSMGQFSGMTPLQLFGNMAPIFKGLGWSNVITSFILNIYYNVIIGWILFYLVHSFFVPLTWASCRYTWNTDMCFEFNNSATRADEAINCSEYGRINDFQNSVTEEFFELYLLKISRGLHEFGSIRWELVFTLVAAWLLMFLCICRGIHTLGKVVYGTVLLPYVILGILLIRGVLLPGSGAGVLYYLTPQWPLLLTFNPWLEAAQQVFWSLAPTWGSTIYLSSRNDFQNNVYRDALVLPIVCSLTSLFGGFVIFSYIGNMAWLLNTSISCIFNFGPALAFIVYPQAVLTLPLPQLWSIMFFVLLLLLACDSAFSTFQTVYQTLADEYRWMSKRPWITKLCLIAISFLLGLPMTTNAAMYIYVLIDWYHVTLLSVVAIFEVLCFAYVYGTGKIRANIESMTGIKLTLFWDFYWRGPMILILITLLVTTIIGFRNPTYGNYVYPHAAIIVGWTIASLCVVPIPLFAIGQFVRHMLKRNSQFDGTMHAIKSLFTETPEWRLGVNFNSEGIVK